MSFIPIKDPQNFDQTTILPKLEAEYSKKYKVKKGPGRCLAQIIAPNSAKCQVMYIKNKQSMVVRQMIGPFAAAFGLIGMLFSVSTNKEANKKLEDEVRSFVEKLVS
jgi:hypothetical protein